MTRDFKQIVLAGGCFWGVEEYYRRLAGITDTSVGYAQGTKENPTYKEVCTGETGHAEAVMITYNRAAISLNQILDHYFRIIDPTLLNQQGNDIGTQYRTGIYTMNDNDLLIVRDFIENRRHEYTKPIVVEVEVLKNYFHAEDEHQLYLHKNPNGYCHVDFSKIRPDELKKD